MSYHGRANKDLAAALYLKKTSSLSFSKTPHESRIPPATPNIIMCHFISSFVLDVYWFVKTRAYPIIYFIWRIKRLHGKST